MACPDVTNAVTKGESKLLVIGDFNSTRSLDAATYGPMPKLWWEHLSSM